MLRDALISCYRTLEPVGRKFDRFVRLAEKELRSTVPVPIGRRLRMWRQGFLGESFVIYRLDRNNPALYVTDFQRHVRTPDLNGRYRFLLKDKLLFERTMRNFPAQQIATFGVIRGGRMHFTGTGNRDAADYLLGLLDSRPRLVVKPVAGGAGGNVRLLFRENGRLLLNDRPVSSDELRGVTRLMRNDIVMEHVQQHPNIAALYPRTTNTLRVLTMWDSERAEPFIAGAVLRIGRDQCYPVDNWSQGGLTADADLETGRLGKGVSHPGRSRSLNWCTRHPDTGARIEGLALPHWPEIRTEMLEICRSLPFLLYVGWDLILTADGFRLLEGNHYPDLNLMQVHRPLLAKERVAYFYKTHGVSKPPPRAASQAILLDTRPARKAER